MCASMIPERQGSQSPLSMCLMNIVSRRFVRLMMVTTCMWAIPLEVSLAPLLALDLV
jgi:hypothetical protein